MHFPPNGAKQYQYDSNIPALATCESYGLGNGAAGKDMKTSYTQAKTALYESEHGDCGGGWRVYMGQSMTGLDNAASGADGKPMLNWWPFLFY